MLMHQILIRTFSTFSDIFIIDFFFSQVVVGEHVLKQNPDCRPRRDFCLPEPQTLTIEKVISHPKFDSEKYWEGYDIALVRVRGNIKLYVRL
jgi:hypothetical protein